jgi:hypothetical protein
MNIGWQFTTSDLLIIFFVLAAIVGFFFVRASLRRSSQTNVDLKFVKEQWVKIEELLGYGKEMNYKLAVIEADKMLDFVLKGMSFPGEKMADRLKVATYKFPSLRQVWWAHKVRNQVVHDPRYVLKYGETKKVIGLFKKALRELDAL